MERGAIGPSADRSAAPLALGTFLLFSLFGARGYFAGEHLGNDFAVYWRVAQGGVDQAYRLVESGYVFPYAPTMLPWIEPLGGMPWLPAFLAFDALGIVLLILALRRHLSPLAIGLCLVSPPVTSALLTGQVALAMAALIVLACAQSNRLIAGVLFGFVASIKPQLVALAPLILLWRRDWQALLGATLSFLLLVAATTAMVGVERWSEWIASLPQFREIVGMSNVIKLGASPAIVAERFGLPNALGLAIGLVAAAAVMLRARPATPPAADPVGEAAIIGTASLLVAPYALTYDLAVLVPFMATLALRGWFYACLIAIPLPPLPLASAAWALLRPPQITGQAR